MSQRKETAMASGETEKLDLPPLKLDREAIAKRLRVPENSKKREDLFAMIDTIEELSAPAVYIRRFEPDLATEGKVGFGGTAIGSEKLRNILAKKAQSQPGGGKPVFVFAATCGQEASDWGNSREMGLPVFWAQTILEEGMLKIMAELEGNLRQTLDSAVSTIEPGIPDDWPLAEQTGIFELLGGTSEDFGIRLNDQSLMLPFRYLAGLAFFTTKLLPQCGVCHFTDCDKQRGGCWRLQAIKRRATEQGREIVE